MSEAHETRDADIGSLFLIAIILLLSVALVCLGVSGLMHLFATKEAHPQKASLTSPPITAPSEPRLETQSGVNLQQVRIHEEAQLSSYGWIDRNSGVAHIPIDRAMELISARGLPDVGGNQTPLQLMQARPQETRPSPSPK